MEDRILLEKGLLKIGEPFYDPDAIAIHPFF